MSNRGLAIAAVVLALFGAVTLFMSTAVIFDLFGIREREGNYVLWVVVANFVCSLLYLPAAWGLHRGRKWAFSLLLGAALLLLLAFGVLFFHIQAGKPYETKTVAALIFRFVLTCLFAAAAYRLLPGFRRKEATGTLNS
jgi:hypothetical protein